MRKLRQNFFYFNIPAVLKLFRLKNQITLNTILESAEDYIHDIIKQSKYNTVCTLLLVF